MKKYRIGYTTGVFDMFHIGHLNILKQAKELCERLIVGVSTDELVNSYKGKLPVIPFEQRIEIVKSIKYVDEVYTQRSLDKFDAYNSIGFDVIFHGDDWKNSNLYNELTEKFASLGVDVVFLKHTEGISSTQIRTELAKNKL